MYGFRKSTDIIEYVSKSDILCFAETWLVKPLNNNPAWLADYNLIITSANKVKFKGHANGGLMIACNKSLFSHELIEVSENLLAVKLTSNKFKCNIMLYSVLIRRIELRYNSELFYRNSGFYGTENTR